MTGYKRREELGTPPEDRSAEGSLAGFPERDTGVVQDGPGNPEVGVEDAGTVPNPDGIGPEANILDDERAEDTAMDNDDDKD